MSGQQQPWAGGPQHPQSPPTPPPNRARPGLFIVAALALVGLCVWFVLARKGPPAPGPTEAMVVRPTGGDAAQPAKPLPPTAESDARLRELARGLSSEPEFGKWLGQEGLVQRFTTAVNNIADGESPRMVLSFLAPAQGFQVNRSGARTVIDSRGYERYESVARVVGSVDAQAAARVYGEVKPLIDGVYAEFAPPGQTFDQTFSRAIQHLLAVPVPQGDVPLVERGALFVYEDPQLEGLSRAQKHLLRMGPAHMQTIQTKLRDLQGALNLPVAGR